MQNTSRFRPLKVRHDTRNWRERIECLPPLYSEYSYRVHPMFIGKLSEKEQKEFRKRWKEQTPAPITVLLRESPQEFTVYRTPRRHVCGTILEHGCWCPKCQCYDD
jgi:hypothetical protein